MKIKILNVILEGAVAYEMIGYSKTHQKLIDKVKLVRPDIDPTQLRMVTEGLKMSILYAIKGKTHVEVLRFFPGFTFDTASVPNLIKWFIDNDGSNMLIPSLMHDAAYGLRLYSRKFSDAMFRALARYYGKKHKVRFHRVKALVAWMGPASPIGKKIYKSSEPRNHFNYGLCEVI